MSYISHIHCASLKNHTQASTITFQAILIPNAVSWVCMWLASCVVAIGSRHQVRSACERGVDELHLVLCERGAHVLHQIVYETGTYVLHAHINTPTTQEHIRRQLVERGALWIPYAVSPATLQRWWAGRHTELAQRGVDALSDEQVLELALAKLQVCVMGALMMMMVMMVRRRRRRRRRRET